MDRMLDGKPCSPAAHKPTVVLLMCANRNESVVRCSLGSGGRLDSRSESGPCRRLDAQHTASKRLLI